MLGLEVGKHTQLEAQARELLILKPRVCSYRHPEEQHILLVMCWGNILSCSSRDARESGNCVSVRGDRGHALWRGC